MHDPDALHSNTRIASALLDTLAQSADEAGFARALRALGGDPNALRGSGRWVAPSVLARAFEACGARRRLARRVGGALVSPEILSGFLNYGGLATLEKAYRRCDQLLAREDPEGYFESQAIEQGSACIIYHRRHPRQSETTIVPQHDDDLLGPSAMAESGVHGTGRAALCGVREGMLESLPLCFGLLPARVREKECVGQGAPHCRFEVEWNATDRKGLFLGAVTGVLASSAILAAAGSWPPGWGTLAVALGLPLLTAATGRSVDLARQLQAVAGSRRGQLALLEMADQSIAEKMDELAKVESSVASARQLHEDRARIVAATADPADREVALADRLVIARASEEIYAALGPLQRGLGEIRTELVDILRPRAQSASEADAEGTGRESGPAKRQEVSLDSVDLELVMDAIHRCVEESRHIQAVGAELARSGREVGKLRRAVSLGEVVSRAVEQLCPDLSAEVHVDLDIEASLPSVRCEPFQMEQVVYQLLRNAADTSPTDGHIRVGLHGGAGGIELTVEDEGEGFSGEMLDRVFDPFDGVPVGQDGGIGLTICARVIEEHGGQFSIAAGSDGGTRVSIILPPDLLSGGR